MNGYSLIELVIVMVISSILLCFAIPTCQHHLTHVRRIDGQTALYDLATRMEHYYSEHDTYESATIAKAKPTDVLSQATSPEHWYTLSIIQATTDGYRLKAVPINEQAANDLECQELTLDSSGVRGAQSCWSH